MRQIIKIELFKPTQNQLDTSIKAGKEYPVTDKQHDSILRKLLESQKHLCCYCECRIYRTDEPNKPKRKNVHIEHFYEQDDYTFHQIHSLDYLNNMIGSCEGDKDKTTESKEEDNDEKEERVINTSCGHKKGKSYHDEIPVNYDLLLNPHDNISHLFSYREGYISANNEIKLTKQEIEKVEYTINRLALNADKLNRRRSRAIEDLQNEIMLKPNPKDISDYLQDVLDEAKDKLYPYFSTLKDNFSYLLI